MRFAAAGVLNDVPAHTPQTVGVDVLAECRPLAQPREHHVDRGAAGHQQVECRVHRLPHAARSTTTVTSPSAVCRKDAGTDGPTGPSSNRCTIARFAQARHDEHDRARREQRAQADRDRPRGHVGDVAPVPSVRLDRHRGEVDRASWRRSPPTGGSLNPRCPFEPRPRIARSSPPRAQQLRSNVAQASSRSPSRREPHHVLVVDPQRIRGSSAASSRTANAGRSASSPEVLVELERRDPAGVERPGAAARRELRVQPHRGVAGRRHDRGRGVPRDRVARRDRRRPGSSDVVVLDHRDPARSPTDQPPRTSVARNR